MTGEQLQSEIDQQPEALSRLIERERDHIRSVAEAIRGSFKYIIIAARGSSDNIARYAKYVLGARNRIPVGLAAPSLFTLYQRPPEMEAGLVIGISQSGRPPDIVAVLQEARARGQPTLGITNHPDSPLAEASDHVIHMSAGEERAVAATKTYTASLTAIAMLSAALLDDERAFDQIQALPQKTVETLEANREIERECARYRDIDHCIVIGRGFNYATCFEIALKIKELTGIIAEPYSSADFLHGPIALVKPGFPLLITATRGPVFNNLQKLVGRLKTMKAELLIASEDPALLEQADLAMPVESGLPEWLTPVINVLPGQLLSLELARQRGLDPDNPQGISKITETW